MSISLSHAGFSPFHGLAALAVVLAAMADWLFYGHLIGVSVSVFLLCVAMASTFGSFQRVPIRQLVHAMVIAVIGALPGLETVNVLTVMWGVLGLVFMSPALRGRASTNLLTTAGNALSFLLQAPLRPIADARSLRRIRIKRGARTLSKIQLFNWLLPILFSLVFILLFSIANPIVADLLSRLDPFSGPSRLDPSRIGFWILAVAFCWPFLRAKRAKQFLSSLELPDMTTTIETLDESGVLGQATVVRALILFNLVFSVETVLDITYLWGGVRLPAGTSYASYAHRGAYTLIATALLAAAFVLFAARPGAGDNRLRDALIHLWVAQNLVLVLSSILRLRIYVDAYALTYWRVAAFIWMGLVFCGLALIAARMLFGKSNGWLINMNAVTLAVVLYATSFANLPFIIANHNVTAALGHHNLRLDVVYLHKLGEQAIPAMDRYIKAFRLRHGNNPKWAYLRRHNDIVFRRNMLARAVLQSDDWRNWTYRRDRLMKYIRTNDEPSQLHLPIKNGIPAEPEGPR